MEAVILIGIQGSGKTTFFHQRFALTHVRISLDLLKTRYRESVFFQTCLHTQQSLVIDNTNPRVTDRAPYIEAARSAGFRVIGYFFDVPVRTALARNQWRTGKARIPVPGILGTYKRLEPATPAEGFDELYLVTAGENDAFDVRPWTAAA